MPERKEAAKLGSCQKDTGANLGTHLGQKYDNFRNKKEKNEYKGLQHIEYILKNSRTSNATPKLIVVCRGRVDGGGRGSRGGGGIKRLGEGGQMVKLSISTGDVIYDNYS